MSARTINYLLIFYFLLEIPAAFQKSLGRKLSASLLEFRVERFLRLQLFRLQRCGIAWWCSFLLLAHVGQQLDTCLLWFCRLVIRHFLLVGNRRGLGSDFLCPRWGHLCRPALKFFRDWLISILLAAYIDVNYLGNGLWFWEVCLAINVPYFACVDLFLSKMLVHFLFSLLLTSLVYSILVFVSFRVLRSFINLGRRDGHFYILFPFLGVDTF